MDYNDISTILDFYYAPGSAKTYNFGPIKQAFVTSKKENLVFHIHENNVFSLTNMKTGEVWTNVELKKVEEDTLSI